MDLYYRFIVRIKYCKYLVFVIIIVIIFGWGDLSISQVSVYGALFDININLMGEIYNLFCCQIYFWQFFRI